MDFPQNPTDGMIFEGSVGDFYQYSAATKSWYKIATPAIPMATSLNDGLMSSGDFLKLTGIMVPPPEIALTFEDCEDVEYDSGLLVFQGDDDGIVQVEVSSENLHENTAVINFKLDTEELVQKMLSLGTLRLTAEQGDQGARGATGQDGANALPVGPQGVDGQDGANAPWQGTLAEESFDVAAQSRAIVDIDVQKVSATENYLVVRRANIGNPDACPNTIIPQDIQSPWILAFDSAASAASTTVISPVTGATCGFSCHSDLYYFDMDIIIQSMRTHWVNYLNSVRAQKEQLASTWLAALIAMFNDQRSAMCCALEGCMSRTRNVETRRYIEQQRIQAAAAELKLIIGGDDDKVWPPIGGDDDECIWNIPPTNFNLIHLSDPDCEIDWRAVCPS